MPSPLAAAAHPVDPTPADLGGEHRAEPVPPEPNGFMADLDAALMQHILHVSKRKRVTDLKHYRLADDLGAGFEVGHGERWVIGAE
jgi:hypothetical protein